MESEPVTVEVGKPKNKKSKWKAFDPAYVILVIAAVVAISYAIMVSQQYSALQRREQMYSGTLSGPQAIQIGDIVPAFKSVDLQGSRAEIVYDGTKRFLLLIFSPICGTCEHEIPLWNALVKTSYSRKFTVRGISIDTIENSRKHLIGKDLSFDVLIMPDMPTRRAYRVVSIPQVMIISEHGTVEWVHYGMMTEDKFAELQSKLSEGR